MKCGRLEIVKDNAENYVTGSVSASDFENPVCVATLHTDGDNPTGIKAIVSCNVTNDMLEITISGMTANDLPDGIYYVDYIITEATNANQTM